MPEMLSEIIIKKIQQEGAISFRDFMEMALYYPELGYYMHGNRIGKKGDYFTGSDVTPLFGEIVGRQLVEMWRILGEKKFTVVEMGAGKGVLSHDILLYLKKNQANIDYCIVEKSPVMKKLQEMYLCEGVRWLDSIHELGRFEGCVFSNELVDAFPVHQVVMENELMEIYVNYRGGFFETLKPASNDIVDYLSELGVVLPYGFRTEINLDAVKWIEDIGLSLEKGFVMTIDYGYPSWELYQDYRSSGTMLCYYKHTVNNNPYQNIGEQDITSHVNFSALSHWGRKHGMECCGFTDLAHFLLGLGIEEYIKKLENDAEKYPKKLLQVKTLMMEMGETFKVLIQQKGNECAELSALKYPGSWKL